MLGIISTIGVASVSKIIENTKTKVDIQNAGFLEDAIEDAYDDGTLIIKNNAPFSTVSNRRYSGTGSCFFDDMEDYIQNRVQPAADVAQNKHNKDADSRYKFRFAVKNSVVDVYYYNPAKQKVIINSFTLK